VDRPDSRRVWRSFLWAGVAAPLVVTAVDVVETFMHTTVNIWNQSISLLSEGPGGGLQRWGLALSGLLTLVFALAMSRVWRQARGVICSQAVLGVGLMVAGLFIQQGLAPANVWRIPSPWGYLTFVGIVHIVGSGVLYAALALSCWLTAFALPHKRIWRRAVWYSALSGLALVLLVPTFVLLAGDGGPSGLVERLAALVGAGWQVWLAWEMAAGRIPEESRSAQAPPVYQT
jgi:hypothetical protein